MKSHHRLLLEDLGAFGFGARCSCGWLATGKTRRRARHEHWKHAKASLRPVHLEHRSTP